MKNNLNLILSEEDFFASNKQFAKISKGVSLTPVRQSTLLDFAAIKRKPVSPSLNESENSDFDIELDESEEKNILDSDEESFKSHYSEDHKQSDLLDEILLKNEYESPVKLN